MSSKVIVRTSHYRHVFGKPVKPELEFTDIKPVCSGDGNYITANNKFFAYASSSTGGGPIVIWPLNKPQRLPLNKPHLMVHKEVCLDFQFNPFVCTLIATASEDCHLKVSAIPEDGLTENCTDSLVDLLGHDRKVNIVHWSHTANNILASASSDNSIKIWDIEAGAQVLSREFDELPQSFDFSPDSSMIASSNKDGNIYVYDPRTASQGQKTNSNFNIAKQSRALWRGDKNQVIAVGSDKKSFRQYGLWDLRSFNSPLVLSEVDQSPGALIPYFDPDNSILYLAGKGDSTIRYFEVNDEQPHIHYLSEYRDTQSQKGICWLPKRCCNTKETEIAVAIRLMQDRVIPTSFQVPRKADSFQKDLYPDCYAGIPALQATEWLKGINKQPMKLSMNPKENQKVSEGILSEKPTLPSNTAADNKKQVLPTTKAATNTTTNAKSTPTEKKTVSTKPTVDLNSVSTKSSSPSSPTAKTPKKTKSTTTEAKSSANAKSTSAKGPTSPRNQSSTTVTLHAKPTYEELELRLAEKEKLLQAANQKIQDLQIALKKQIEIFNSVTSMV